MKYLALILAILMAVPTVQAGFCDMDQEQGSAPHADMQHQQQGNSSVHDCCDTGDTGENQGCDNMVPCGFCTAGLTGITALAGEPARWTRQYDCSLSDGCLTPSHSSPPFRPPIS